MVSQMSPGECRQFGDSLFISLLPINLIGVLLPQITSGWIEEPCRITVCSVLLSLVGMPWLLFIAHRSGFVEHFFGRIIPTNGDVFVGVLLGIGVAAAAMGLSQLGEIFMVNERVHTEFVSGAISGAEIQLLLPKALAFIVFLLPLFAIIHYGIYYSLFRSVFGFSLLETAVLVGLFHCSYVVLAPGEGVDCSPYMLPGSFLIGAVLTVLREYCGGVAVPACALSAFMTMMLLF